MSETGHFQRLVPIIAGLGCRGVEVHALTDGRFGSAVRAVGGRFVDLFERRPLDAADATSTPVPCGYVTFTAYYCEDISRAVEDTGATLVIHDSFAVVARVVASRLALPRVNMCFGHNGNPAAFLELLADDPRVSLSPACVAAVDRLRTSYGLGRASPFSYVDGLSPDLNICGEPQGFLDPEKREVFEPVAFFGSLPSLRLGPAGQRHEASLFGQRRNDALRVYVSFGTVVWRYYADAAMRALSTLASAFERANDIEAVVSFRGTSLAAGDRAAVERPNVGVDVYVDQ